MTPSSRLPNRAWILPSVVSLLVFVGLYGLMPYCSGYGEKFVSILAMLYALSTSYGSWEHCLLVFPIAGVLLYLKRKELSAVPVEGNSWGLVPIGLAMFVYWVGYRTNVQYFGFVSAQIFIGGLIIFFLGWKFFKQILFPWAFLAFAWPFLFLDNEIAFPLRIKMSALCYHFLNLIGLPTLQSGTALVSAPDYINNIPAGGKYQVDIADPCSGIRSLFALTMISSLYGYLTLPKTWQKIALFSMAFPLAIAGNFVRILLLTFGTLWFGSAFAIGSLDHPTWFHMAAGYFVYIVALGGMVAIGALVSKNWFGGKSSDGETASPPPTGSSVKYDY